MIRLGLTGGIASGKSTVAAMLEARGFPVLDADTAYHALLREDRAMLSELREAFGPEVFQPDGSLDRKALGAQVFGDATALARLGAITHPRVRARLEAWLGEQASLRPPPALAACVVPLLFENRLEPMFDRTLLVEVPEATQRERLMARDGLDPAAADRRIASQMPLGEKRLRADLVLPNTGPAEATATRLDRLLARLLAPVPPSIAPGGLVP